MKKILEQELHQAKFDAATNFFDQARTYIDKSKDAINNKALGSPSTRPASFSPS